VLRLEHPIVRAEANGFSKGDDSLAVDRNVA
jgi:hypothetical protein